MSPDVRTKIQEPGREDRAAAKAYMRECRSSLIDMALAQKWSRSLEDIAISTIRQFREQHGRRPSHREMEGFRIPPKECEYYAKHGIAHLEADASEIIAARRHIVVERGQVSRRMTGDAE